MFCTANDFFFIRPCLCVGYGFVSKLVGWLMRMVSECTKIEKTQLCEWSGFYQNNLCFSFSILFCVFAAAEQPKNEMKNGNIEIARYLKEFPK